MTFRVQIGQSDFRRLRASGGYYVDKSAFVGDVLNDAASVMLFLRPRRFGKTLNLSTLRWFLEKNDEPVQTDFEGLAIWKDLRARQHFQRHPVLTLTFKDAKASTFPELEQQLVQIVAREARRHRELEASPALGASDRAAYLRLADGAAQRAELMSALLSLSEWLQAHHREPVVMLLDEYDTPIEAGMVHGYAERALEFFRDFLSAGLKDNANLQKGVLTGITRIAKESLFSGLNNLTVYGAGRPEFGTAFGFTEGEVRGLLALAGQPERLESVAAWYDGYAFSSERIYNPWSIMSFLASEGGALRPYWVSTGSNELLRQLLLDHGLGLRSEMVALLEGESIDAQIDESMSLRELEASSDAIWSFLLQAGYLTAESLHHEPSGQLRARFRIPNLEVRGAYLSLFSQGLEEPSR